MEIGKLLHRIKKERSAYVFILPTLLLTLTFLLIPMVQGSRLSFFRADLKQETWLGLQNYFDLFQDSLFWLELKNTLIITGVLVPLIVSFSLLMASLILKFNKRLQMFFLASFYLPVVMSGIIVSMVWLWIFNPTYGLLNYLLSLVGIEPVIWLGQVNSARFAVIIVVFTWLIGADIILYLAAISAIPRTIYEAAMIDGTNIYQKFFKITIPLVMPMTLFILVTTTMGTFQIWEAVYLLTRGGPAYTTTTIAYRIYQLGFRYFRFGQASTQATVLLIIVFSVSFIQFKYLSQKLEF